MTNKSLIIAEKPSLAQKIIRAVGGAARKEDGNYYENNDYVITSVFGHILTLKDLNDYLNKSQKSSWELSDLNYFPEKFEWKIKDNSCQERYNLIKKLIQRNDINIVVNAGDADREGEVLINNVVYKIFNELNLKKKVTRIWLEDQTEQTINNELNNQRDINDTLSLYKEGLARSYIDWLYGIYLTRYVSIKAKATYPVGRVIIPTVKFVYDRDKTISDFQPEEYLKIVCEIEKDNEKIKLDFSDTKFSCDEKSMAKALQTELKNNPIAVELVETKDVVKSPKKLFSLSSLQNYMNKNNKWSLKKTLDIAQSLYEKQLITYPRTNTEYLAEAEKNKILNVISKLKNELDLSGVYLAPSRLFDDTKIESHSAITITNKNSKTAELSADEKLLYDTIFNRCFANFYDEKCVVSETKVKFRFQDLNHVYTANLTGQTIKQQGYLKFENDLKNKTIPNFQSGERIFCNPLLEEKTTKPPSHVTENELNKYFENPFKSVVNDETTDDDYKNILSGVEIGTVATRAGTIEKVIKNGYVSKQKNSLLITQKGISLIEILTKLNINLWAEKTVVLSQDLKRIYKNELKINDVVSATKNEISEIINQNIDISNEVKTSKEIIGCCPLCGKPVYENKKGYGCSGYKDGCKFVVWKNFLNKTITVSDAKDLLNPDKKTTKTKKGLIGKKGKPFDAKLILKDDNTIGFKFK